MNPAVALDDGASLHRKEGRGENGEGEVRRGKRGVPSWNRRPASYRVGTYACVRWWRAWDGEVAGARRKFWRVERTATD